MGILKIKDGDGLERSLLVNGSGTDADPFRTVNDIGNTGPQKEQLFRLLDVNGDGTGVSSAVGDFSTIAQTFYIQPPAGVVYRIARMIVHVEDSGSFDSGSYGNGITMTNGVVIRKQDDSGTVTDFTAGHPITVNPHWGMMCFDVNVSTYGSGNEHLNARWTFAKSGQYLRLDGDLNERLEVVLNDDLSGLVEQHFLVQGYIE